MATVQKRGGTYRILFMYQGKRHSLSLGKVKASDADAKALGVQKILAFHKSGYERIPPGVDIVEYMRHDGREVQPVAGSDPSRPAFGSGRKNGLSLQILSEQFIAARSMALEESTIVSMRSHLSHIARTLGKHFPLAELARDDLQRHINRRVKEVSATTASKEIVTLRTAWGWACDAGLLDAKWPGRGLSYPKTDDTLPFMTRAEIERRIKEGGDPKALWPCLYLAAEEITLFLDHVQQAARPPWLYAMVCLAAHTGARRSELIRAEKQDVDLTGTITIREKKKARGKTTTRNVPMSSRLKEALTDWLKVHPGGKWLFCHGKVLRSRVKRSEPMPISRNVANDQLKKTLANSRWEVVRGFHVLRHSLISTLAAEGVDSRLIMDMVGHLTADIHRRYTHLTPKAKEKAIRGVFG